MYIYMCVYICIDRWIQIAFAMRPPHTRAVPRNGVAPPGLALRVSDLGLKVQGLGFRVQGLWFRV